MKVAIYGRPFSSTTLQYVQKIFDCLAKYSIEPLVYEEFYQFISGKVFFAQKIDTFSNHEELKFKVDLLLSLGGDGTMLDSVALVRNSLIPIIGINFGRLGFLASINKDDISGAIESLVNKQFTLESRDLLSVTAERPLFDNANFALNDVIIHRSDNSAMMIIHAYLNDEYLNSYWADGLIVATPTGSTAYSLSCGGPIIFPESENFVITPVSPHNLNVRPVVVSDSNVLSFEIEGRSSKYLLSCDSRTETIDSSFRFEVRKANFSVNLIRLKNESYLSTLRNKLLWGIDTRNY